MSKAEQGPSETTQLSGSPSLLVTLFWCASVQILRGPILIPPLNPKARPAGHTSPHCQVLMATAGGQVQNSSLISCLLQQHRCSEINPPLFECLTAPYQHAPSQPQRAKPLLHLNYQEVYQMSVFKMLNARCRPFHGMGPLLKCRSPILKLCRFMPKHEAWEQGHTLHWLPLTTPMYSKSFTGNAFLTRMEVKHLKPPCLSQAGWLSDARHETLQRKTSGQQLNDH